MRAELRDFAGRFLANVNGDADRTDKRAQHHEGDQPGRNVTDSQGAIKVPKSFHCVRRVQKDFRDPRDQDQDENENVIAFQPAPDRLQLADLETGKNEILANQLLPIALKQVTIFHHHRHEKMRFQHPDARTEGIVKTITARFDPEQHPNNCEIEKENDVRHARVRERNRDNGSAAGDSPVGSDIEPLPPNHDSSHFAAVKMRHGVDVARIVDTALDRNSRLLLVRNRSVFFSCHGRSINWISATESNISSWPSLLPT